MRQNQLPQSVIIGILSITLVLTLMSILGWGIDYSTGWLDEDWFLAQGTPEEIITYYRKAGPFAHTILEWTAVCIAIFTGVLSVVHYRLKFDVTTPIIGISLFFSGMLDVFNILAADHLLSVDNDLQDFIPFTWAISRTFNVAILTAGTVPFLIRKKIPTHEMSPNDTRYLLLVGLLFGLVSYGIIHICAAVITVPESFYPELWLSRPWEMIPLLFWIVLGIFVLPRFWKKYPSLFSHSLILCVVPAVFLHLVAGFGSRALFDVNFFNAYLLKIVVYMTPMIGLLLDYKNAYRAEMELEMTASKLEVARQIQRSLLPSEDANIEGIEIAGFSYSSDAVGGDYFDYITFHDERFGFVVGDVSGHDLAASLLAAQSRAYLRAYVDSHKDLSTMISKLNHALVIDTQQKRFVTMFMGVIDQDRQGFDYAAAGHQAHVIRENGECETLDSNGLPLGMTADNEVEIQRVAPMNAGDMVLVVTDGITEAVSPAGEQYGIERLIRFVQQEKKHHVQQLTEMLRDDVNRFCEGIRPIDDVTVLLVRWQGETGTEDSPQPSEI